jgi:hypothetical protein
VTLLVNYFEAHAVGHALEGLRYALGYAAADPAQRVSVLLNAQTAVELTRLCPFLDRAFDVRVPAGEGPVDLDAVPPIWDVVVDNPRRRVARHVAAVPGFARYFAASDAHLAARRHRGLIGSPPVPYRPHQDLRLSPPAAERARARALLGSGGGPRLAVLPAGSGRRWLYPSPTSWERVLRALVAALPGATVVLLGKLRHDGRTASSTDRDELGRLARATAGTVDAVDLPLLDQLAVLEGCDLLIAPHSGFAFLASTVDTPWLAISGGPWPEYFFNGAPFHSVLPDPVRYPWFTMFADAPVLPDDEDGEGPRVPSMSARRIREDLDEIISAARRLLAGEVTYEAALAAYFPRLVAAAGNDPARIWSFDDLHRAYL